MKREIDTRCLQHDHHFSDFDLYDDYGESLGREAQLAAKCTRCGKTMKESLEEIASECKAMLNGYLN